MLGNVTLSPRSNAGSVSKCRGDGKDVFTAERTTRRFPGNGERLIDMPLEPLRTDPAPQTGQVLFPVLECTLFGRNVSYDKHVLS